MVSLGELYTSPTPQLLNLWGLIGFTEVLFSKVKVIWGWRKVVTPLNHIVRNFFPFQFSYTPHYVERKSPFSVFNSLQKKGRKQQREILRFSALADSSF